MKEIWRILKFGGILTARVPDYRCCASCGDPTHVRFFSPPTLMMFTNPKRFETSPFEGLGLFYTTDASIIRWQMPWETEDDFGTHFTELCYKLRKVDKSFWDTEPEMKSFKLLRGMRK